jgi:hypothetical protein
LAAKEKKGKYPSLFRRFTWADMNATQTKANHKVIFLLRIKHIENDNNENESKERSLNQRRFRIAFRRSV